MSLSLNGSTQYASVAPSPVTVTPLTVACWFKPDDHNADYSIVAVEEGAATGNSQWLCHARGFTSSALAAMTYHSAWAVALSTDDYADDAWNHGVFVFAAAADRRVYLDGTNKGTDSTSQTPSPINNVMIGGRELAGPTGLFPGKVAHVAIWNVALSDSEAAQLAAGANPLTIQAANLVAYWPMVENGASVVAGIADLTEYGTPTWDDSDNPTVDDVAPTSVTISGATEIYEGYSLVLTATAAGGSGNYTYQWNKEGSPITGQTSAILTISDVDSGDAGSYTCTVTNGGGSKTSSIATVTVSSATVAFVTCGQRSAANKNVWAYNEAGVLLWSYDTASTALYGAMLDDFGRIVVWGASADNGDGNGTRSIWRLDQSGAYIDGTNVGTTYSLSIYNTIVMTVGGSNDVNWLYESDLSSLDTDTQTMDGAFACLLTEDGNSWYGYQNNVSGPDYYFIRELDVNRDEVFAAYVQVTDNERITALKENSSGKVIAFSGGSATVRQHTSGGAGGFAGDWETTLTGWGLISLWQNSLYVDQSDSNKIYCIGDGFGVLNSSGVELYNVSQPAKGYLTALGPYGSAGKMLVVSQKDDGCELYMWDQSLGAFVGQKSLEGPDDGDYVYGLAVAPNVSWNFAIAEELDSHSTDNLADSVTNTVQIAQTFTLSDYKKTGLVVIKTYRASTETVTVSIQGVDGEGKPDGSDLCSGTHTIVNSVDSSRYKTYVFMSTTPVLPPGTYAIVVKSGGIAVPIGVDSAGGHSGQMWDSTDGGSTWTANGDSLTFDLWGDVSGYTVPSFDAQSGNQSLYVGQTPTTLSVTVSGNPTPTLQWYANGSPITGETGSTYSPPAQSSPTLISYTCRATNLLGYTDTTPMVITWSEEPPPAGPVTYRILNLQLDLNRS